MPTVLARPSAFHIAAQHLHGGTSPSPFDIRDGILNTRTQCLLRLTLLRCACPQVTAFVLETPLVDGRGISLTHFTDEDVAAEAVEAYEAIDEDEDEELDALLEDAAAALDDEALAFDPEAYLEDDEEDAAVSGAVDLSDHEGFSADLQEDAASQYALTTLRAGLIKGKNGQVAPMGLPNRPLVSRGSVFLGGQGSSWQQAVCFPAQLSALFCRSA